MNTTRILGSGAGAALALSLLTVAPAQAGGDPGYPVGTISVERTAVLDGDTLRVGGSYTCEGAGDRIGTLGFEVQFRGGSSTERVEVTSLRCDGASHAWATDVPVEGGSTPLGSSTFWGSIQVCETPDGPCPMKLVEERVVVRPG
ncbi:hypothetical protein N865_07005 [Intrasporangium oryzae NRRL B-24470]|uniref:Secreted protein n=1 Tax=Intrasporangium oryzae NRRL B-24470 TaxID=1386089 RepID=W9G7F7_9MICO|nr:hypothetical protein [Intrasporangium oryzae]EWT02101.1 hypothetical protein N865_07005 [Intrasporangium oryzae NRRL B-24470]